MSLGRPSLPPPGWYPDPVPPRTGLRWWDGLRWTAEVAVPGSTEQTEQRGEGARQARGPSRVPAVPAIPARAVWWAVLGLVVGEIVGGGLAGVATAFTGNSSAAAVTLAGELGLWGGMLWSCALVSRRYGTGSLRRDLGLAIRRRDVGLGVVVAAVGIGLSATASAVFSGTSLGGSNTQIIAGQRHNGAGAVLITLVVALGAPIFEELFFRGLIRAALTTRFGPTRAILAQGLLFGLAHYEPSNGLGNVSIVLTIALLGVVLGYVATRTGRLGPGMVGHSLFNLVASILVLTT